jgi:arabinan endo-1,5-alpha-L-arabinosidase
VSRMRATSLIRRTAAGALLAVALLLGSTAPVLAGKPGHGHGPPLRGKLDMVGDIGDFVPGVIDDPVHDPTLFSDRGTYYVFSTGILNPADPGGIFARRSTGTLAGPWESLGAIPLPEWTRAYGVNHLWAPHVVRNGPYFYLYYAASSFGTNTSAIGVARTRTPGDLTSWVDLGPILTSDPSVNYNAIDPMVFRDHRNQWWITFGSFWDGIKLQRLAGMTRPVGPVRSLARHPDNPPNPIENPQIFRHGRYYYLLVSWDFCCRGVQSTYRTVVGRSTSVSGPYLDRNGVPLAEGGGTVILSSRGNQIGPGAPDVLFDHGRWYMVHHYYDANAGGVIRMQIREIEWDGQGWPYFSPDT